MNLPFDTPDWIQAIVDANDGGWAVPFKVTADHPIRTKKWTCLDCGKHFRTGDVAVVMPFSDISGPCWTAQHRECLLRQIVPEDMR